MLASCGSDISLFKYPNFPGLLQIEIGIFLASAVMAVAFELRNMMTLMSDYKIS